LRRLSLRRLPGFDVHSLLGLSEDEVADLIQAQVPSERARA